MNKVAHFKYMLLVFIFCFLFISMLFSQTYPNNSEPAMNPNNSEPATSISPATISSDSSNNYDSETVPLPMPSLLPSSITRPTTRLPKVSTIPSTTQPSAPSTTPASKPPSTGVKTGSSEFEEPVVQEISEDELDFLQDPNVESQDVESFYGTYGFNLFPRKKLFSWRNILRNSIYFNNNVYYNNESADDTSTDTVYILSLESQLEYKPSRSLEMTLSAGFGLEQYFNENQQNFLPRAQLEVRFKEGMFYATFKDRFIRNTALVTGEINKFSLWWRNNVSLTLGIAYERFLFEVFNFHEFQNYDELSGDYQFYGQTYTIGYRFLEGLYGTLAYGWDHIAYRDGVSLNGTALHDTTGQSFLVGLRMERLIQLTRNLGIYCGTGMQERRDHWYWRVFVTLDWKFMEFETRRFKVDLTLTQQTQPSMLGDYRLTTSGNLILRYLLMKNWAITGDIVVAYNDPLDAKTSMQYGFEVTSSHRLWQGVDLDLYYHYSMVTSKDSAQEYRQHILGASVTVIF